MKPSLVQEIKSRLTLSSVIKDAVELRPSGGGFIGLCPFHDEKTPSFNVRDSAGLYKCFGCGASGDMLNFIMRLRGIAFKEAVAELAERAGIARQNIKYLSNKNSNSENVLLYAQKVAHKYFIELLKKNDQALGYLKNKRGLDEAMIEQAGLGYGGESKDHFLQFLNKHRISEQDAINAGLLTLGQVSTSLRFKERIIFPIKNEAGKLIAFGGRAFKESNDIKVPKYINTHSYKFYEKKSHFYGLSESKAAILQGRAPVLVEGYFDAMAFWAIGYPAIALCGTSFTSEHASIIKKLTGQVLLCFDSDSAGFLALHKAIAELLKKDITPSVLSCHKEDPGNYLMSKALEDLKALASSPKDALIYLIEQGVISGGSSIKDSMDKLEMLLPVLASIKRPLLRNKYVAYLAKVWHEDSSLLWAEVEKKIARNKKAPIKEKNKSTGVVVKLSAVDRLLLQIIWTDANLINQLASLDEYISSDIREIITIIEQTRQNQNDPSPLESLARALKEQEIGLSQEVLFAIDDAAKLSKEEALLSLEDLKKNWSLNGIKKNLFNKSMKLRELEQSKDFTGVLENLREKSLLLKQVKINANAKSYERVSNNQRTENVFEHKKEVIRNIGSESESEDDYIMDDDDWL